MKLEKLKIINACDKIILFSICAIAFYLPISKAIIETFSYIAIVCFIAKKLISKEDVIVGKYLKSGLIAYIVVCLFSVFISVNPAISIRSFLAKVMQDVFFFLVVIDTLNNERRIRNVIYILFFSSFLLGIDGIYQNFTHKDFLRNRSAAFTNRISASFMTPNDFGCYLIVAIPFTISMVFSKFRFKLFRFIIAALFILLFICLLLTVSRGAWFAFMILALFMSIWFVRLRIFLLFLVPCVIASLTFFPPLVKQRLANLFVFLDYSGIDRKLIWGASWKMFISRPWLGLGLGTFMFNFDTFVAEGYLYGAPYAHNCYLQMLTEIGIIGLACFLSIIGLFFYNGIKIIIKNQRTFCWYALLGSLAAVLGYCVHMGVDTFLYSVDLGLLFWFILGIGIAAATTIFNQQVIN